MTSLRILPEQIEHWPVARLKPYARNPRLHSADQVAKVAASIASYGWTVPLLVTEVGEVIAGHGRLLAARHLGLTDVPVIRLSHLSPEQVRAYRVADNQLVLAGAWDEELLAAELHALNATGFDLNLIGFDQEELDRLLAPLDEGDGLAGEDATPEPPLNPVSRPGDLWLLGGHRLLCGDSTKADDVVRLLVGTKPNLMVTDPPYGVSYDPAWRNDAGVSATARTGTVRNDDRADWREAWALFSGDVAYVWHAGVHGRTVADSLEACGFGIRAQLIWVKTRFVLSRGHYHWQHEPCFYAVRDGGEFRWQGARDQSTVWQIATNARRRRGDGARHAEAGRVHAAADPQQQRPRRCGVRAVRRQWHHHHRCREVRPPLSRHGDRAALLRRDRRALAEPYRQAGHARWRRPHVPRDRGRAAAGGGVIMFRGV